MRLIKLAALALSLAMPVKVSAEDLALLIAKFDGEVYENQREVQQNMASLERAYRDAGFTLTTLKDLNPGALRDALETFEQARVNADRLVVHYIGGVLMSDTDVRLNPAKYEPRSITEKAYATPSLRLIYQLVKHRPGKNAVVLASANPSIADIGALGPSIPNGLLVLSGKPFQINRAVRDGLMRGETGRQLGQRAGVHASGFVSDIALVSQPAPAATVSTAADGALVEMRVWREAAQNGSPEALKSYIDRYPNGLFRGEAQARLNALVPQKTIEQTTEENLSLSRADRRRIQRNLTLLGYNTRGVDGLFGRGSRNAIERWQSSEGFRSTGYLDGAQIRVLNEAARVKQEADRVAREREDVGYWQQTGSGTNPQGLRDYLAKYPDGLFSTQAKQALARFEQESQTQQNQSFIQRENALNMNGQTRALVEQRLKGLGYNVGPADGNFTNETRVAIRDFQQKAGINPTGYMDNQTVTKLVASIFR